MRKSDKTVVICILARDCNRALKRNIPQIERVLGYFSDARIIVVENDSIDGTKDTLHQWAAINKNVTVISEDTQQVTIPKSIGSGKNPTTSFHRIHKMAQFRNKYLSFIKDNNIISDYIIVIDIDLYKIYPKKIISAIKNAPDDWCAIFANGLLCSNFPFITKYYDDYAYLPYSSDSNSFTYRERLVNVDELTQYLRKNDYVKVHSAFAGIGIYTYEALCSTEYRALPSSSGEDEVLCEHVSVNLDCAKYGSLYVSKKMKIISTKPKLSPFIVLTNKTYIFLWEKMTKSEFSWNRKLPWK